jgi:hypothetical protein
MFNGERCPSEIVNLEIPAAGYEDRGRQEVDHLFTNFSPAWKSLFPIPAPTGVSRTVSKAIFTDKILRYVALES